MSALITSQACYDQFIRAFNGFAKRCMTERERRIIELRYGIIAPGIKHTLRQTAQILGMSGPERVRQCEIKALRKLRTPTFINQFKAVAQSKGTRNPRTTAVAATSGSELDMTPTSLPPDCHRQREVNSTPHSLEQHASINCHHKPMTSQSAVVDRPTR